MELANSVYPMRAAIRSKAKQQLLVEADNCKVLIPIDEELFKELATTLLQLSCTPMVYQPCRSKQEAVAIEDRVATELAASYRRIAQQQQDPLVQRLNALL